MVGSGSRPSVVAVAFYTDKRAVAGLITDIDLAASTAAHAGQIYGVINPPAFACFNETQLTASNGTGKWSVVNLSTSTRNCLSVTFIVHDVDR